MEQGKTRILIAFLLVGLLFSIPLLFVLFHDVQSPSADALRFKEEHEAYNGAFRDDGTPHVVMYVPENNRVVYLSFDALIDMIDSGTGVFFFSRPVCPWCRIVLPIFLEVADYKDMYVFYYDIDYDRSAHNQNYITILERLHDYLPTDDRNQSPEDADFDPEIKRVTVPHFFVVRDGVVVAESMMNRHPLLVDEDWDGIWDYFLDMFRALA